MNKKMKDLGFFSIIKHSFWSSKFYAYVPKSSFWKAFFTLLGVSFIVAGFIGFSYIAKPLFASELNVDKVSEFLVSAYPEDLELTIENGLLSTNVEEPYTIELPVYKDDKTENLLVIDTQAEFTVSLFDEYHTLAFANETDLYIRQMEGYDGEFIAYSFSAMNNDGVFRVNRYFIVEKVGIFVKEIFRFLPAILVFFYLMFVIGQFMMSLIFAIFMAFIVWGVSANFHELKSIGFSKSYKLVLYGMIPALFVKTLLALTSFWTDFRGFPLMMSLLTLIVVFANLQAAKEEQLIK